MSRRILRALAVVATAGAPLVVATGVSASHVGCSVTNLAPSSHTEVQVVVAPLADPPVGVTVGSTSTNCSYVSDGGQVDWGCTLIGGRCQVFVNGVSKATCVAYAGTSCASYIIAQPGDTIALSVTGGNGFVADAA